MKLLFTFSILIIGVLNGLQAQVATSHDLSIQHKSNKSTQFGFDTYVNDKPLQNQQNFVICSAFNGWLYAAYSYFDSSVNEAAATVLRSKDNGITWSMIFDETIGWAHTSFTKLDIIAVGQDTANLKFFLGYCVFDSISTYRNGYVARYNGNTGLPEEGILDENSHDIRDLALATDGLYPAANANPFSIGVIYTKKEFDIDYIVFRSSSNGGMSFDNWNTIAVTTHCFNKVDLAYGRSESFPGGRYFAVWEEKESLNNTSGHIYTAHSEPYFNSDFTSPVLLDNLDPSSFNSASNPVIACQNSQINNDSSNFTEVVLFEKYRPGTNDFNIAGVFSKVSTAANNFQSFNLNASSDNILQPNICFNPFESAFNVTCFDATHQKLPYLIHDFNMANPDSWSVYSSGYNDNSNLVDPYPQVAVNFVTHSGVNGWIGSRPGGNGAAMFDAPLIFYTGIHGNVDPNDSLQLKIFPNPATEYTIVEFQLQRVENVNIYIVSPLGQLLACVTNQSFQAGKQFVRIDLANYPVGFYILSMRVGNVLYAGKVTILR